MTLLLEKWNKFKRLNEFVGRPKHYESHSEVPLYAADCILRYNREVQSQADILTHMRAIEGVTIITVIEPARRLGEMEVMRIKAKYTPIGMPVDKYTAVFERKSNAINGVLSLHVLRAIPA